MRTAPDSNTLTVLHVFATLQRGGGESRTLGTLQATRRQDQRHIVLTVAGQGGPLRAEFERAGAEVRIDRMKSPGFVARFLRLLREENVGVVHTNIELFGGILMPLSRLAGVPQRIVHLRTDGRPRTQTGRLPRSERLLGALVRSSATRVIGVAPSTLENLISPHWERDPRMLVLPNGFDIARYRDAVPADDLPPAEDVPRILHVGRDAPMKNRERALRIMASPGVPADAHLLFVGRNDETHRGELEQLARTLGVAERVHFLGERGDIPAVLRGAHALLQTSTYEGLPGVLLEGLMSGLPVVASDLPGTEFIRSKVGYIRICPLAAEDDVWADALADALSREGRGEAATAPAALAGTEFDMTVSLARVESLWDEARTSRKESDRG